MTNELRDAEEVQEKAFRNEGTLVRCAMVIESLRAEVSRLRAALMGTALARVGDECCWCLPDYGVEHHCPMCRERRATLAGEAHARDCGWHKDWHSCSCGKFDAKVHIYMPECTGPIYCGCKENK